MLAHGQGTRVTEHGLLLWAYKGLLPPQAAMLPRTLVFSVLSHDIWIRRRPGGWLSRNFSVTAVLILDLDERWQ